MIKWTYVVHQPTDQDAIMIQEGEFEGVVATVTNVKFPMYTDEGEMVDLSKAEEIPLTFDCEILYNPTEEDLSTGEFEATVGNILMNIIDESLEHDQIEFRTDDSI